MTNTFEEREPFKKRIVSASLTEPQRRQFDELKAKTNTVTDGAMIKKALADMVWRELEAPGADTRGPQT